jgi:hypothetical protein
LNKINLIFDNLLLSHNYALPKTLPPPWRVSIQRQGDYRMVTLEELEDMKPGSILRVQVTQEDIIKGLPGNMKLCGIMQGTFKLPGRVDGQFTAKGLFLEIVHRDGRHFWKKFVPVGREAPEFGEAFDENKRGTVPGIYTFVFDSEKELDPTKQYGPEKAHVYAPRAPRKPKLVSEPELSKLEPKPELKEVSFKAQTSPAKGRPKVSTEAPKPSVSTVDLPTPVSTTRPPRIPKTRWSPDNYTKVLKAY